MKRTLSDAAAKLLKPVLRLPIELAHLMGLPRKEKAAPSDMQSRADDARVDPPVPTVVRAESVPPDHSPLPPWTPAPARRDPIPNRENGQPAEEGEAELRGGSLVACARRRERARCAAIVMSAAGKRNPVLARALAFETSMTRSEALAYLELAPQPPEPDHQPKVWSGSEWVPEHSFRH